MALKLGQYKGVVIFSILKYVEIILTSLTTFFLAKKLGPSQLGMALPILLYITYANYLALGLNQVVTKNFSRIEAGKRVDFITINLQYLLLSSILNILLAVCVIGYNYGLIGACISILIILRGFFSAYFRAIEKISVLNINNIIFSSFLFISVLAMVDSLSIYLNIWAGLLLLAVFLFFLFDYKFFTKVFLNLTSIPSKESVKFNLYEGMKLAITGGISTILLTCDRFIINQIDIPIETKGSVQLADYVGMAVYMIATTIIFYFYPSWVKRIREDYSFCNLYLKYCTYIVLSTPILIIVVFFLGKILIPVFFSEYPDLLYTVCAIVFSKMAVIALGFISLFYIGKDEEKTYMRKLIIPLFVIIIIGCVIVYFKSFPFIIVPLINGVIIFIVSLFLIRDLRDIYLSKHYNG